MLDYKPVNHSSSSDSGGDSLESAFMSTFSVSYTDMYSCQQKIDLKENGEQVPVTEDNVQVIVCMGCVLSELPKNDFFKKCIFSDS